MLDFVYSVNEDGIARDFTTLQRAMRRERSYRDNINICVVTNIYLYIIDIPDKNSFIGVLD